MLIQALPADGWLPAYLLSVHLSTLTMLRHANEQLLPGVLHKGSSFLLCCSSDLREECMQLTQCLLFWT